MGSGSSTNVGATLGNGIDILAGSPEEQMLRDMISRGEVVPVKHHNDIPLGFIVKYCYNGQYYAAEVNGADAASRARGLEPKIVAFARKHGIPEDDARKLLHRAHDFAAVRGSRLRDFLQKTASGASARAVDDAIALVQGSHAIAPRSAHNSYAGAHERVARRHYSGGNENLTTGGCGCDKFIGSSELTAGDLKNYETSLMSKTKAKIIEDLLEVARGFKLDVEGSTPSERMKSLHAKLPERFRADAEGKIALAMAKKVNEVFGENVVAVDQPQLAAQQITEIVLSLSSGMHTEFLAVNNDVKRILSNLSVLKNQMKKSHEDMVAKLRASNDADLERSVATVNGVYELLTTEMDRQVQMLNNLLNITLQPAEKDLAELIKGQKDVFGYLEKVDVERGVGEFGKTLINVLKGMGVTTEFAKIIDKALKEVGMKIDEYSQSTSISKLREKITAGIVGKNMSIDDLHNYLEAADLLYKNFHRADEIAKQLANTRSGGSGGDNIADMEEQDEYLYAGGHAGGEDVYAKSTMDKRIENTKRVKNLIFETFYKQLNAIFDQFVGSLNSLTMKVGSEIPLSDELSAFRQSLVRINASLVQNKNIYYFMIGYFNDAMSRSKKDEFLAELRLIKDSIDKIMSMPKYASSKAHFAGVAGHIDAMIGLVTKYSDEVAAKFGRGEDCPHISGGAEDDENSLFRRDFKIKYKPTKTIVDAMRQFDYFYRVAQIKANLQATAGEIGHYSEKYENLVAHSIGEFLKVEKTKYDALLKLTNDAIGAAGVSADDKKQLQEGQEIMAKMWETKLRFWETVEAVDKYMQFFTDGIVKNPNDVKDIKSMLDDIEVISEWYNEKSGNTLVDIFEAFAPAPLKLKEGEHYYETVSSTHGTALGKTDGAAKPAAAKNVLKNVSHLFSNLTVLKNFMSIFVHVGSSFGGQELRKKVFMSPSKMYDNLVSYIQHSSCKQWHGQGSAVHGMLTTLRSVDPKNIKLNEKDDFIAHVGYGRSPVARLNFLEEDRFFVLMLKSMAAKILTVVGLYDVLDRPHEYNGMSPVRMIIGGSYQPTPKLEEAAVPIYFRLPLLAQFYKKLFGFGDESVTKMQTYQNIPKNKAEGVGDLNLKISLVPDFEGPFAGLISLMFRKNSYLDISAYSDDDYRDLFREINLVYQRMVQLHPDDVVTGTINDFVAEINKRYGIVTQRETQDFEKSNSARYDYSYGDDDIYKGRSAYSEAPPDREIILLPGETEEDEIQRPAAFTRLYGEQFNSSYKSKQAPYMITDDYRKLVYKFRCALESYMEANSGDSDHKTFHNAIKAVQKKMTRESDDEKRFSMVSALIRGVDVNNSVDAMKCILFHETVVTGLNTLSGLHTVLAKFKSRAKCIDIKFLANCMKLHGSANAGASITNCNAVLQEIDHSDHSVVLNKIFGIPDGKLSQFANHTATAFDGFFAEQMLAGKYDHASRTTVDRQFMMQELIELINSIGGDFQKLVDIKFDEDRIVASFGGLRALIEELFESVSFFATLLRPFIEPTTFQKYYDKLMPGSFYWLQEQLMEKIIVGRKPYDIKGPAGATQKDKFIKEQKYQSIDEVFRGLSETWKFLINNGAETYDRVFAEMIFYDNVKLQSGLINNGSQSGGATDSKGGVEIVDFAGNPYDGLHFGMTGGATFKSADTRFLARFTQLYTWENEFTLNRSALFSFNQLIAKYVQSFFDPVSGKMYFGMLDKFANGPFNRAIADPLSRYPDTVPTLFAKSVIGKDVKIPASSNLTLMTSPKYRGFKKALVDVITDCVREGYPFDPFNLPEDSTLGDDTTSDAKFKQLVTDWMRDKKLGDMSPPNAQAKIPTFACARLILFAALRIIELGRNATPIKPYVKKLIQYIKLNNKYNVTADDIKAIGDNGAIEWFKSMASNGTSNIVGFIALFLRGMAQVTRNVYGSIYRSSYSFWARLDKSRIVIEGYAHSGKEYTLADGKGNPFGYLNIAEPPIKNLLECIADVFMGATEVNRDRDAGFTILYDSNPGKLVSQTLSLLSFNAEWMHTDARNKEYRIDLLADALLAYASALEGHKSNFHDPNMPIEQIVHDEAKKIADIVSKTPSMFQYSASGQPKHVIKYDDLMAANYSTPKIQSYGTTNDEAQLFFARKEAIKNLADANSIRSLPHNTTANAPATSDDLNNILNFGQRLDPDGEHVLFASLADIIKNIITSKTTAGQYVYCHDNITDVPLYMKEKMRVNLPMFRNLFKSLVNRCESIKRLLSIEQLNTARCNEALVRVHNPFPYVLSPHVKTTEDVKHRFIGILDSIIRGCMSLIGTCDQTLRDVGDDPKFMETYQNSIRDYKSQYGVEPLMPLSSVLNILHSENQQQFIPVYSLGSDEFKFNYGIRSLIHNFDGKPQLEHVTGYASLIEQYNMVNENAASVPRDKMDAFMQLYVRAMKFLFEFRHIKPMLSSHVVGGSSPNTLQPAKRTAQGALGASWFTVNPAGRPKIDNKYSESLVINPKTVHDITGTNGTTLAPGIAAFSITHSMSDVVKFIESSFKDERVKELAKHICGSTVDIRDKMEIRNIIDLNIVPINVHALMREVPLVNLYNYAYTYDRLMVELLYDNDKTKQRSILKKMCSGAADEYIESADGLKLYAGGAEISTGRDALCQLLLDPYVQVRRISSATDAVKQMMMGAPNTGELGRPRFLSDQLLNKVLLGELYSDAEYSNDEVGPISQIGASHVINTRASKMLLLETLLIALDPDTYDDYVNGRVKPESMIRDITSEVAHGEDSVTGGEQSPEKRRYYALVMHEYLNICKKVETYKNAYDDTNLLIDGLSAGAQSFARLIPLMLRELRFKTPDQRANVFNDIATDKNETEIYSHLSNFADRVEAYVDMLVNNLKKPAQEDVPEGLTDLEILMKLKSKQPDSFEWFHFETIVMNHKEACRRIVKLSDNPKADVPDSISEQSKLADEIIKTISSELAHTSEKLLNTTDDQLKPDLFNMVGLMERTLATCGVQRGVMYRYEVEIGKFIETYGIESVSKSNFYKGGSEDDLNRIMINDLENHAGLFTDGYVDSDEFKTIVRCFKLISDVNNYCDLDPLTVYQLGVNNSANVKMLFAPNQWFSGIKDEDIELWQTRINQIKGQNRKPIDFDFDPLDDPVPSTATKSEHARDFGERLATLPSVRDREKLKREKGTPEEMLAAITSPNPVPKSKRSDSGKGKSPATKMLPRTPKPERKIPSEPIAEEPIDEERKPVFKPTSSMFDSESAESSGPVTRRTIPVSMIISITYELLANSNISDTDEMLDHLTKTIPYDDKRMANGMFSQAINIYEAIKNVVSRFNNGDVVDLFARLPHVPFRLDIMGQWAKDTYRSRPFMRIVENRFKYFARNMDQTTYINEKSIVTSVAMKNPSSIGKGRFDTKLIRNIVFITNLYRTIRMKLQRDLMYNKEVIAKSIPITKNALTEFYGNEVYKPTTNRFNEDPSNYNAKSWFGKRNF